MAFIVFFTLGIFLIPTNVRSEESVIKIDQPKISEYGLLERGPISIHNNDDFATYGFPGNGSEADPYRIEYFNITTTADDAIGILTTDVYFIIQHCYLQSNRYGILLKYNGVGLGTIFNNTICNTDKYGIYVTNNNGITIANNTLDNPKSECNLCVKNSWEIVVANNTLLNSGKTLYEFQKDEIDKKTHL